MWNELSVGQFISLYDIEQNQQLNIVEKQQKMLSVLEGKTEEDYDNIKYRELVQQFHSKLSFFNEIPESKPVDYLQTKLRRYKFCFELSEITAGQYIDINNFSSNLMQLNKIAACFFLPMEGDKYMEYGKIPHDIVAEDLLDAKFIEVYGCMVFFYQLFKELISDIITYSTIPVESKEALMRLWKDGDGYIALSK
jgi:hypothetical protein